ncbi:MAG: guanylate kinase [Bacteroidales bacterium]|nr:guanylate kinase [Bacteroidales bacterium]
MEGKLFIFSAPSGSGKTTIVKKLLDENIGLEFSVSATNRPKRENEVHGKDYYFLSTNDFKQKIKKDEFVEWEEVYNNRFYGTLKSELKRIWEKGKHVVFDVDVVGGLNIKKKYPEKSLAIFIMPPNINVLEQRLRNRSTDSNKDIEIRVAKAKKELAFAHRFDMTILNEDLNQAVNEAKQAVINFINQ